jgi:hypothetical protein
MKVPSPWPPTGETTTFFRRRSRLRRSSWPRRGRRLQRLDVMMASMSAFRERAKGYEVAAMKVAMEIFG